MRKYRRSDRLKAQKEAHHETELHDDQLETITGGQRSKRDNIAIQMPGLVVWDEQSDA